MNEDSYLILDYLPFSYKTKFEDEYINFLWDTFQSNYENKKYQFAFLAYHMLFMSFVYFNIWQIRLNKEKDFLKALIGFNKDIEKEILGATSPFTFHKLSESSSMRFFKLIDCDNQKIGEFSKNVKDRNDIAHSNGNIYFNDEISINEKINKILECVMTIQEHSKTIIQICFKSFLINNWDNENREYLSDKDQINEILIHSNYFSKKDIEFCLEFDINNLSNHKKFKEIRSLFKVFRKEYRDII